MLYEVKILIFYLRLYFANIVRTSTSGLDSKIVWFYASVKMNPIKLELKIDKRKSFVTARLLGRSWTFPFLVASLTG